MIRLLRRLLWEQWQKINADEIDRSLLGSPARGAAAGRAGPSAAFDYRPLVVLVSSALLLTLMEYWGQRGNFDRFFAARWIHHPYYSLAGFAYWALWRVLGYLAIPALIVAFMPGERVRDYGLRMRGIGRHFWIYVVLYLLVLPPVVVVSLTSAFQQTYPFYRGASLSWLDLVLWEILYGLQFLALEFFFRGFMLHGLKRAVGSYAIFAMVVPYCMIHYGKPLPETLGAIVAGLVLGTLALRTRSIWLGVLIHTSVAWTMDLLALAHTSGWPRTLLRPQ